MPAARLRRLSKTLPGMVLERLPSGNHRIRVRVATSVSEKITIPANLPDDQFMEAYKNARNGYRTDPKRTEFDVLSSEKGFKRAIGDMFTGARQRAVLRECACTITREDLIAKVKEQGGLCAVTGMKFSVAPISNGKKRPLRMSVDRIDRSGGYTPDNIRITTAIANIAMMDWDFDDFVSMCRAVTDMHGKAPRQSLRDRFIKARREQL